jgi:hypothetical protein
MLSENYSLYTLMVVIPTLNIPVNVYCLYHLIKVTKLNAYIKVIFAIMVIHSIAGYIAIFCSLIPIMFFDIQNRITCTVLTTPLAYGGAFFQLMSAMTSLTRLYMTSAKSNNEEYQDKIIIFSITFTMMLFYSLPIITEIFYDKYMVLACMNRQDVIDYHNPMTVIITTIMALATFCGTIADICMMNNKDLEQSVPRNSTLFSTATLCISGLWFAFCETLADTLFMSSIVNIFIIPFMIKFTISSNLKTQIGVPTVLQFHDDTDPRIYQQDDRLAMDSISDLNSFENLDNEGKT